jgi:magnesium-transporting ATPase (P-type)
VNFTAIFYVNFMIWLSSNLKNQQNLMYKYSIGQKRLMWMKFQFIYLSQIMVRVSRNFFGHCVRRKDGYLQWIAMISVRAFFYCCQHTLFYCLQLLYASSGTIQQWLLTMLSTHRRHLCSKIWDAPTMSQMSIWSNKKCMLQLRWKPFAKSASKENKFFWNLQ